MAGYTRQSTFADGDTITAALFNNEYNQLLNAFSNTGGHKHDGTAAEGPVIGLIGDAGVTTPLNKVLIDSTNDHIEFWIEVSSSAVQQLYIADGAIVPVTDNDIDLGTSSLQFKDLYINGTANIDSLVLATGSTVTAVLDEDDLSSDSATSLVTQQSVKAYIDAQVTAQDLDFLGDSGGALSIDLDSESLTIAGGTGLDTVGSSNTITINIDATVATLTGTQTLTNKTIDVDNNTVSNIEVDNFKASAIVLESEGIGSNDNDTSLPTSAAVKDYVDTQITAEDLDITTDSGTIAIDLDSETLTVSGGTGLDSSATGNAVTLAIDSTVTTLTGTQTLTNKTLTTPVISSISNTGTLTLPTSTDTLVGRATTDTLTNKTLTSPVINTGVSGTAFLDDDTFGTATASTLASSESIKAYVDAQVATADSLAEVLANGNTTGGSNILFADNDKAIFGAGSDLQIYHDGINSYISDTGTGNLNILANEFAVYEGNGTDLMIGATPNGAVTLSHNAQTKLATTSTGIDVTGTVTADGLTVEAGIAQLQLIDTGVSGSTKLRTANAQTWLEVDPDNVQASSGFAAYIDGKRFFDIEDTGDISFYEDTGTTQALFWDASAESLGIGTTSPSVPLHVAGGSSGTNQSLFRTSSGGGGGFQIVCSDLSVANPTWQLNTFFGEQLAFGDGTSEHMRIDSSGKVGIGTDSPDTLLELFADNPVVRLRDSKVKGSSWASGDALGGLEFYTSDTTGIGTHTVASITAVNGGQNASSPDGEIVFSTGAYNTAASEVMRIDSSGNVGIGTTSPSEALHVKDISDFLVDVAASDSAVEFKSNLGNSWRIGNDSSLNAFAITQSASLSTDVRLFIANGGNVGIGTTSPDGALDIEKTVNTAWSSSLRANDFLQISNPSTTSGAYSGIELIATGTGSAGAVEIVCIDSGSGSGDLAFSTRNGGTWGEKVRVTAAGNVGIGTDSPSEALHVYHATANINAIIESGDANAYLAFKDNSTSSSASVFLGASANDMTFFAGGTTERMRIDSSGNVGIGVTNPSSYWGQADNLVVGGTGNDGITIKSSTSGNGRLIFTDTESSTAGQNDGGQIQYNHASDYMTLRTNGAERMRIDSSGNLLVGTTSTTFSDKGVRLWNYGNLEVVRPNDSCMELNRTGSDGIIARFHKDGTTVGSIGTSSGDLVVGTGNTGLLFFDATPQIIPRNTTGANVDDTVDLGASGSRFKDIYATNGTIQTSDRNEKQDIEALTDAETRVAVAAKGLLRKFKWKDAVASKGDDARIHFGIIAQDLQDAFTAEGLDAGDYAMFISSTWTDDDGVEQTRLGVRYSELLAFIIAAI